MALAILLHRKGGGIAFYCVGRLSQDRSRMDLVFLSELWFRKSGGVLPLHKNPGAVSVPDF